MPDETVELIFGGARAVTDRVALDVHIVEPALVITDLRQGLAGLGIYFESLQAGLRGVTVRGGWTVPQLVTASGAGVHLG